MTEQGEASYYNIITDSLGSYAIFNAGIRWTDSMTETELKDAAWYYPETKEKANNIKGYVAFWKKYQSNMLQGRANPLRRQDHGQYYQRVDECCAGEGCSEHCYYDCSYCLLVSAFYYQARNAMKSQKLSRNFELHDERSEKSYPTLTPPHSSHNLQPAGDASGRATAPPRYASLHLL